MFRSLDDDHNGALDAREFTKKLKQFNVDVKPDEVDRMIDVLQFSKPGCITYQDFVSTQPLCPVALALNRCTTAYVGGVVAAAFLSPEPSTT